MKKITGIFNQGKYFLLPYLILFIACFLAIVFFTKSDIHIWFNQHHIGITDFFFKYYTNVGDGWFVVIVSVLLLFYRYGLSLLVFATYAISGLMAQFFKRIIFSDSMRPVVFFHDKYNLHLVNGVSMNTTNSYPSGHTVSAFAMFLCFALATKNKYLQLLFFIMACLVGYSRIYLSQHFLADATAGSFLGVLVVIIYYYFHVNIKGNWFESSLLKRRKSY
jgi:membrane-associated phospholipid phosphatase